MITNENRNEVAGLCITCNHAGFCIYLASASSTIWCCEEFDDRPPIIKLKKVLRVNQPKLTQEKKSVATAYAGRQMRKAS